MMHTVCEAVSAWLRHKRGVVARIATLVCLLAFLASASVAPIAPIALALPPQKFQTAPLSVSILNGELFVNLSLTVDDEDGLRDLLKDGAVLQLEALVSMFRERSWWTDVAVAERDYRSLLFHDPLTRDFVVSFPTRDGEKTLRDKNLTRLIFSSWRNLSLPLVPLRLLYAEGDGAFTISLSLSLHHTEVPPWLEKSFVFWSSDVVPGERLSLPFTLPVESPELQPQESSHD